MVLMADRRRVVADGVRMLRNRITCRTGNFQMGGHARLICGTVRNECRCDQQDRNSPEDAAHGSMLAADGNRRQWLCDVPVHWSRRLLRAEAPTAQPTSGLQMAAGQLLTEPGQPIRERLLIT